MLKNYAMYLILGKPLIMWGGLITLCCVMLTAFVGAGIMKGKLHLDLKWHLRLAGLTMILALIHGIIGVLLFF